MDISDSEEAHIMEDAGAVSVHGTRESQLISGPWGRC
ncbi:MAG: hypothetical protein CM15mV59_1530 [Caudoviricetes sp.]|nr:MAG: hypothetical protein CM15mV59_1530 [Caudoviricetes sp.]